MKQMPPRSKAGILYIVATPIGNLEDITLRAIRILKSVALIAAEDTRNTRKLLNAYGIRKPLTSLFDNNESAKSAFLVGKLIDGSDIAYVSDAGTPGISDPGYILINEALKSSLSVVPVPGASAVIAALSVSGLPMDSFIFHGFLPQKKDKRRSVLSTLKEEQRTIVLYESAKRLLPALRDILDLMGDRSIAVARELTKMHEEVIRGTVKDAIAAFADRNVKGEITLIVEGKGKSKEKRSADDIISLVSALKKTGDLSDKEIVRKLSDELGVPKRDIYQSILSLKHKNPSS